MSTTYVRAADEQIDWVHNIPFIAVHLAPLGALWSGASAADWWLCLGLYWARIFFITAGYHRYFSHRAYKMGRVMQFLMAFGGCTAVQKGPLWWASLHRHHHKFSDQQEDIHSPHKGLFWSHVGWIMCSKYRPTNMDAIKDFAKFPELRLLNRFHYIPPIMLGVACFAWGGWGALFVGFFLSTVINYHCTYCINSLTHLFGRRRYVTEDTSRNSFILAVLTFGEGWHNNHHYYQSTANQGFFWWELDVSYYILVVMSWFGLVRDLRKPPQHVLDAHRIRDGYVDIGMFKANWARAIAYLNTAKQKTGAAYDERKRALDELVENTSSAAQRIADMSVTIVKPQDAE